MHKSIFKTVKHFLREDKVEFYLSYKYIFICSGRSIRYKVNILSGIVAHVKERKNHYQSLKTTVCKARWNKLLLDVYHLSLPRLTTLMFLSHSTHLSGLAPSLTVYRRSLAQTSCRQSGCLDSLECCSRLWHNSQHRGKMFVNSAQIAAAAEARNLFHWSLLFSAGPHTPVARETWHKNWHAVVFSQLRQQIT